MNSKSIWTDQIPERDGIKTAINDVAISPDGSKVIAAAGNRVLLYKAENGDLIDSLRGHKDTVYSVAFSCDGTRFASGGADNVVVIWKSTGQGLLKYNHTAPIQRVIYSPTMLLLASCSDVDFGLWTPDQKQVIKEKVSSRILSASWSSDGTMLAVGMLSGLISIRNQQGDEMLRMERRAPIWSLVFIPDLSPPKPTSGNGTTAATGSGSSGPGQASNQGQEIRDLLVVGCWDRTYSLYKIQVNSSKLLTEKALKYYPCSITYSGNQVAKSSYLVISGSNRKVIMYSREGAKLTEITEKDSWIWGCACHGDSDQLVVGTHFGGLEMVRINFDSVHALYRDRYAYRENLTEVIVHHLVTDKKVRIKCKDLIQNLSMYKNKLAVQLSDRVCIYESSAEDTVDMHFRLRKEKIVITDRREEVKKNGEAKNLMGITSSHLIFCVGNVVELYTFDGQRQKVWSLDSFVNCMRVDGGTEGREGLLLGLQSGSVAKLFVDNPFPLELTKRTSAVVSLDINIYRTTIATVDSTNTLLLTDLRTQDVLFSAPHVTSACFNSEVEDLICITGIDSSISVLSGIKSSFLVSAGGDSVVPTYGRKSTAPELQDQHIFGLALGFKGQKIFCLHRGGLVGVDVPQGTNMQRALEANDVVSAYKIACLGATEADWKLLAMRSLRANHLSIAKQAFARLKDTKFLSLIDSIERQGPSTLFVSTVKPTLEAASNKGGSRNRSTAPTGSATSTFPVGLSATPPLDSSWLAELLAYEGHHQEAAKVYARAGRVEESIRLFTDLRRWEDAKMFSRNAGIADVSELTMQQAKWLQEINDWKGSSELFVSMGQFLAAAKIIGDNGDKGWEHALIEVVRACPIDDIETMEYCGDRFSALQDIQLAKESYTKAKLISKLMALYAKRQMWNEAAKLADENEGKFDVSIFLPYAEWLVSEDRYEEAMLAFKKSKRQDLAQKVLEDLTNNAIAECRFKDAAYYYWMLAKEIDGECSTLDSDGVESVEKLRIHQQSLLQYEYEHKADLYYAYANVHSYVTDPFTSQQPEMLFQVSRFIINSLGNAESIPIGVSKASTLFTLAKQAMLLGAYKLARHAYDRLSKLQISDRRIEEVEIDMLLVQAKPVRDDPDQLPVCYRCSSTNPLLNPFTNKFAKGDVCTNCGHPFVRSFLNFDILPLVEFVPEPSITDEEAVELIRQPPASKSGKFGGIFSSPDKKSARGSDGVGAKKGAADGWKESKGATGQADTLMFEGDDDRSGGRKRSAIGDDEDAIHEALGVNADETDLFTRCLNLTLEKQRASYTPVKVDANTLLAINRSEVFVCRSSSKNKRATFYRNMLPDIPVAISQPCHRFFHLEDFEFAYLSGRKCPYSRLTNIGEYGSL